ncbi:uncharacterized protein LOC119662447 [Teleopsis dalmanni]|uniref:uncharacterized protein LOC119662447 n=1 Tax=Teleopsis dalmanni TaxID=139649 RepID=UPI0018CD9E1A|nr:uncharacterized protein LOC119662447 [Teleopsis dalmanni]XP_037927996.1 uncharacterized protein LOC119662447 [Teleopsis dalmanni]XP_037927997.1 uncharacterized protein LOC119662447 [Teleopsis dalmanni]
MYVDLFGGCSGNQQFNEELNQLEEIVNHDSPRQVAQQFTSLLLSNSPSHASAVSPEKRKNINKKLTEIFRQEPRSCRMAQKLCSLFEQNDRRASGQGEETDTLYSTLEHIYMHETPNNRFQNQMQRFLGSNEGPELNDMQIAQNLCRILHAHIKFANDFGMHLSRMHQAANSTDRDQHNSEDDDQFLGPMDTLGTNCEGNATIEPPSAGKYKFNIAKNDWIEPKQVKKIVRYTKSKQPNINRNSKKFQKVNSGKYGTEITKINNKVLAKVNPNTMPKRFGGNLKQVQKMTPTFTKQSCRSKGRKAASCNSDQDNVSIDCVTKNMQVNTQLRNYRMNLRDARLKTAIDASVTASIKVMFPKIDKKILARPIRKKLIKKIKEKPIRSSKLFDGVTMICPENHEIRKTVVKSIKDSLKRKSKWWLAPC